MTPPTKKAKSSWLLYLLASVLVAICVCTAVIIYLTVLRNPDSGPDLIKNESFVDVATTTTTILSTTVTTELPGSTETTTAGTTTIETTVGTTTSTEENEVTTSLPPTTEAVEISMPVDIESILQEKSQDFEIVEKCQYLEALPVACSLPQNPLSPPTPSDFQPIHYNLNITIRDIRKPVLEGNAKIFAKTLEQVQGVSLHSTKLHNIGNQDRVRILNCDTGETICVSKINIEADDEIVFFETAQKIEKGTNLRIDINGFISADSGSHVYKQIPTPKWRAPAMIGTVFEPTSARNIFPSFDNFNQKATFSLCLNHGPSMSAISNSLVLANISQSDVSCFEKSVPLTAQQIGFAAFEKTTTLFFNHTTSDSIYLPEIQIINNFNSPKPQQYEWIYSETSKVMALLSKWSAFSYPLNRLKVIVSPVMVGHSALGIITLPAQAVAHQKHTSTHETLIKEVIGQWMEGVVTTEHTCFEKALITYLEWKVNEELQIVKKTRKAEISRIRPRNLNETQDQLRVLRSVGSSKLCSTRFTEVFYTLDETYGSQTVIGIIKEIFDKFAFSTVTISDWQKAAEIATGRPEAGQLLQEWFTRDQVRPVLRAFVQSQGVEFQQLTNETWTVPLEISGSSGTQLAVIKDSKQMIPFVSTDYVVIDPSRKSHAFVVYDADTYLRLIRCYGDSIRCPSKEIGKAFGDLAAALLANILPAPENQDVAKWKSVFKFMAQQNLVEGTAACCVEHAIREMRKCSYWDIQDVCTKIRFNTVLAAVA